MHELWRAEKILSRMPQHLREALPQKLAAYETFCNRRFEWGYSRYWLGDYLLKVKLCVFLLYKKILFIR